MRAEMKRTWAEVSMDRLAHNYRNLRALAPYGTKFLGLVKADAYGHGSVKVAEVLRENGVKTLAIATLQEAVTLREAGAKEEIIMLGLTPDMYADVIVEYDITPVVCDAANAAAIAEAAKKAGKVVHGLVAVDTGMGRIGYLPDDANIDAAVEDVKKMAALEGFKIKGLFSHMSTAAAFDKTYSHWQDDNFNKFYDALVAAGVEVPQKILANSAAIMELPTVYFDACRPGIILYGQYPSDEVDRNELDIKPVMQIKANIIHLKEVGENFSVGYGRRFISERPSKIATLALGYADGYPRPYSSQAKVIVNGVLAPIAGNICMDQCMVDVTDVPDVKIGVECIIMGTDGNLEVSAEDIAKATGTINYEICCAFGQRLPKVYVK